jgi:hypothetical protein
MVLHEVLIRVIADYEVRDPEADVKSLGQFRAMTRAIFTVTWRQMDRLIGLRRCAAIEKVVASELANAFSAPRTAQQPDVRQRRSSPGYAARHRPL